MAVEKFINLMMKRHKPVSHKDNHNRILKNKPLKRKVVVQLTRFEKILYIALITVIALISIYMLSLKWMRTIREEKLQI